MKHIPWVKLINTWVFQHAGKSAGPVFAVAMGTHAVDLDGYDLRQLAVLRTDKGQELQPASWNAPTGGHHRSGMLIFPATFADGTAVIGTNTRSIELIIRNVAGIAERTLASSRLPRAGNMLLNSL